MKKIFTLLMGGAFCAAVNTASAQTSIWKEDFESVTVPALPSAWSQDKLASTGWKTHTGAISFPNGLDPFPAHTKFAVVDDWNNNENNSSTILISPYLDLAGKTGVYLKFEYFFHQAGYTNGGPRESAYLQGSIDSGKTWIVIDTIKQTTAGWKTKYASLGMYDNMSDVLIGFKYHDGGDQTKKLFGLAIDDVEAFIPIANDLMLTDVTPVANSPKSYAVKGTNKTLSATVFNNGGSTISSFTLHYQEGASTAVADIISSVNIAPFTSYDFTIPTPLSMPSALGDYPVSLWVELTGDLDPLNDTNETVITAVEFMPKKKILAEEATGTWCGWCPRGAVYMDSVWNTYPSDFSLVAVHNNDPMVNSTYDNFMGGFLSGAGHGYPSVVIDRNEVLDPSQLIDVYNNQRDNFGYADIILESPDAPSFDVKVKVTVKPAMDLTGEYRLAVAITEDDVRGETSKWGQANYYSNYLPLTGAGIDWYAAPSTVPASEMNYDFVARMIYPSPAGAAGSLPSTMTAGSSYDHTFQFAVDQPFKRPKLHAVVMLIRSSDGHVMNSNYTTITAGVSNIDAGITKVSVYPNPANDNAFVNFSLKENSSVVINVTDAIGRIITTIPSQKLNAGSHKMNINTSNIPAGIYNVTVLTDKGSISERLSVVK